MTEIGTDIEMNEGIVFCDGNAGDPSEAGPPIKLDKTYALSLNQFKGTPVELTVRVYNRGDNWYNTWAYIDDFSVLSLTE